MKVEYNNLQKQLMQNLDNEENLHRIIQDNKSLINKIVKTMGSGNHILTKPYDTLYEQGNYNMLLLYQTEIEDINEVALFGEDG